MKNILSGLSELFFCVHKKEQLPQKNIRLHNHDGYEIYLFLDGTSHFLTEHSIDTLKRGDLYLIPPFSFHGTDAYDSPNYERAFINIRMEELNSLSRQGLDFSHFFNAKGQPDLIKLSESDTLALSAFMKQLQNECSSDAYGSFLYAKSLLTQILIFICRHKAQIETPERKNFNPELTRIFDYINAHLTEKITLEDVARQLPTSSNYLSHFFKNNTGVSFRDYIIAKRIALSQQHILEGCSITESCYLSGFHNYANFSRTFSKQIGMSPKEWKNTFTS